MVAFIKSKAFALAGVLLVAGCAGSWQTNYDTSVSSSVSKNWRFTSVDVQVPDSLTTSEENSLTPNYDIIWQEEPLGNSTRHAQVDTIMTEAAKKGVAGLRGSQPVKLVIVQKEFHALTKAARYGQNWGGVHNISFTAQVFDSRGNPLTEPEMIQADLVALTGARAVEAESRGITQRKRIVEHVSKVIAGWLGATSEDRRTRFSQVGR
ncbi:hypothetical protein C8N32_10591 [Rhodovulum imhoffii]|uniref:Lipoprotein n=1 Tax=Rhodovulum imhoffii TaxID=365340 RepID=A0A2T5BTM8_9RHOB|nr:DUF6778 family protein [Rhodovulum imhoffii]MBK5934330.1 hypothetical protein [Rhodovulum imhoffii]PTN02719.1 hypothetical protein C8N32_10591 [Rhodovulum imhoffii]